MTKFSIRTGKPQEPKHDTGKHGKKKVQTKRADLEGGELML